MERSGKMTIEEVLAVEEMQVFDRKSVNIAPKVLAIPIIAFERFWAAFLFLLSFL